MDKVKQTIEKILLAFAHDREVYFPAKDLSRKCDPDSSETVEKISYLAYSLYINEEYDICFSLCELANTISLEKSRMFDAGKYLYALYAHLLKQKGQDAEAQACIEKVRERYKPKPLKRFLNGELLYTDSISKALEKNNEDSANYWRFVQFRTLFLMQELGGSENYPPERIRKEIAELKDILFRAEKSAVLKSNETLHNDSVKDYWTRIENWLSANAPAMEKELRLGATEQEIQEVETLINMKLPDDFIESCLLHNGQQPYSVALLDMDELLSLERIAGEWKIWKDLYDSNEFEEIESTPEKGIKNDWYNPMWIPITSDGCGNNICIDLDPAPGGQIGQVIRMWHDDDIRTLEAPSFKEWLRYFAEDIENGRYTFL